MIRRTWTAYDPRLPHYGTHSGRRGALGELLVAMEEFVEVTSTDSVTPRLAAVRDATVTRWGQWIGHDPSGGGQ